MNDYNSITATSKYKHLSFEHYEHIIREITKHDAFHNGKKRNTGRTALVRSLASTVGTSVSNVYSIINDASISIQNSDLTLRTELSASAAFHKRSSIHKISNISKLQKAHDFLQLVVDEVKNNTLLMKLLMTCSCIALIRLPEWTPFAPRLFTTMFIRVKLTLSPLTCLEC